MNKFSLVLTIFVSLTANAETSSKSGGGGRYQVLQLSSARRDQVMIDTQTGKIWHYTCLVSSSPDNSECASSAWISDEVEGITRSKKDIYKDAVELEKYLKERKPSAANQEAEINK